MTMMMIMMMTSLSSMVTAVFFLVVRAYTTVKYRYMCAAGNPKTYGRSWIQPTSVHHWSICTCNNKLMGLLMVASYRAAELPYSTRDLPDCLHNKRPAAKSAVCPLAPDLELAMKQQHNSMYEHLTSKFSLAQDRTGL